MFRRESIVQFVKFGTVGLSNFAISYSVYYLLFSYETGSRLFGFEGFDAVIANTVGYIAGILNSFFWNRLWTFKTDEQSASSSRFVPFILLNLLCLSLSSLAIYLSVDVAGLNFVACWLVVMTAATVFNFGACKLVVFRSADGNRA